MSPQCHITTSRLCWPLLTAHWQWGSAEPGSPRNGQNDPDETHRPPEHLCNWDWQHYGKGLGSSYHLFNTTLITLITFVPCYSLSSVIHVMFDSPNTTLCLILCHCQQQSSMHPAAGLRVPALPTHNHPSPGMPGDSAKLCIRTCSTTAPWWWANLAGMRREQERET